MPTIEISEKMLRKLSGPFSLSDLAIAKADCEKKGDMLRIEIGDTNRPDLWSAEGLARLLRSYYGRKEKKMKIRKGRKKIIVSSNIKKIRPFIAGFIARNVRVTEELLKDMIQIQEKISDNFGKKRKKISIGIYNHDKIKWPVYYKATGRKKTFIPLEFKQPMTLEEILDKHPKGIEYGYIVRDHSLFPIFVDKKENVLSFPPIINSNFLGRVEPGRRNLFIEVTGTDFRSVILVTNILTYAFHDRSAKLESVNIQYPWKTEHGKKVVTPLMKEDFLCFSKEKIKGMLGIELKDKEISSLLKKMQYKAKVGKKIKVTIPPYRNDVMSYTDVIEDIAIAYGYNNFSPLPMKSYTAGKEDEKREKIDKIRDRMIGLGFQEILSPILIKRDFLDQRMNIKSKEIIEIENPMSENYNSVRSWILPNLMGCLSKNLHRDYPQKIFEVGEAVEKSFLEGKEKVAACIAGAKASYQDISSVLHAFLGKKKYKLKPVNHNTFIKGRCAEILLREKTIGLIGEIHPKVLNNWRIEKPVVGFEMELIN